MHRALDNFAGKAYLIFTFCRAGTTKPRMTRVEEYIYMIIPEDLKQRAVSDDGTGLIRNVGHALRDKLCLYFLTIELAVIESLLVEAQILFSPI